MPLAAWSDPAGAGKSSNSLSDYALRPGATKNTRFQYEMFFFYQNMSRK